MPLSDVDETPPRAISGADGRVRSAMNELPIQHHRERRSWRYAGLSLLLSLSAIGTWLLYARWHGEIMRVEISGAEGKWLSWGLVTNTHLVAMVLAGLALVCAVIAGRKGPTALALLSVGIALLAAYVTWIVC